MQFDPDDRRPLFQVVVDDLTEQIESGQLRPDDKLPTAAQLAQTYGIANMTAQRALRELQNLGLTYARPGKGTFVRPDAPERLSPSEETFGDPSKDDPDLARRLQAYRASNAAIELKIAIADKAGDTAKVSALHDELLANIGKHVDLLQEHYRYLQAHGLAPADEPATKPAKRTARPKRSSK